VCDHPCIEDGDINQNSLRERDESAMKKRVAITGLSFVGGVALAYTAQKWVPWLAHFANLHHETIEHVKTLIELVLIPAPILVYLVRLWWPKTQADGLLGRTPQALHQLPPPPGDFTGRGEEIKELLAAIKRKNATLFGLRGLGGIGKTALALKLAERLVPRYPDAQIFLDLLGLSDKPLSAADALAYVLRAFYPGGELPQGEADLAALYRSTLHGKRAVLLMDNVRDAAQVERLRPPAGSVLIVTSRFDFEMDELRVKDLKILPPEDACSLLLVIAPRIDGHAGELANLCGYLPQALRSVASTLAKRVDVTPQAYTQRLAAGGEKLDRVEASLRLSYDLLGEESQKLFPILSVFAETFDARAAAAVWDLDIDPAMNALGDLLGYRLLEWNAGLERYSLHNLVRPLAEHKLTPEAREPAARRHARYYVDVLREADKLYRQGGEPVNPGLALYDVEKGNIKAGQAWAAEHAPLDDEAARLCSDYAGASALLGLRQNPHERIPWVEAALAAARRLKDRRAEGEHSASLGLAYADSGEPRRAIEFHQRSLEIMQELGDRKGEGRVLGNLGLAYVALGKHLAASLGLAYADSGEPRRAIERAIEYHTRNLDIARQTHDRRGEGRALGNLGYAHDLLGEPGRAIDNHKQRLAIAREIHDRRGEGNGLFNMSLAQYELGERSLAIANARAALKIREQMKDPGAEEVRKKLVEWGRGKSE
jgi:tetratricopeptide (TPR) repeat protein